MNKFFLALISASILFYGCKNEDIISTPELTNTQSCQDNLIAESIFNDVGRIVEEGFLVNSQSKSCPGYNLINTDTLNIDTLIIDFGNTDCLSNGKLRKGKIISTYNKKYLDSLSVINITFDNYYVSGNLVQGERIIKNQGKNNNGNMWFIIEVNDASIITSNGTINWQSNRQREWINGQDTYLDMSDDTYKVTGTASGNGINNNSFTMTINKPLNMDLSCMPSCIVNSGTAKISPNGYADRIINYGDSLCDCNIDVIINEENFPIVLW
jgi:hypothetical protein